MSICKNTFNRHIFVKKEQCKMEVRLRLLLALTTSVASMENGLKKKKHSVIQLDVQCTGTQIFYSHIDFPIFSLKEKYAIFILT